MATSNPAFARATAMLRPMPVADPVTSAVLRGSIPPYLFPIMICYDQDHHLRVGCVKPSGTAVEIPGMTALTLREQNKSDKLKRIQEAARPLFGTQGFDATSTREM